MITELAGRANSKTETFFARHAWKILFSVSLLISFFGVGDMLGGASDLQNGETVMMHSYGTPVPIISGSILFVLCMTLRALSYCKFFQS